jgi:hypothetical protein
VSCGGGTAQKQAVEKQQNEVSNINISNMASK